MTQRHETIGIGVCTCQRPGMVRECLLSLTRQQVPAHIAPHIIVVDNESEPNNRLAVADIASTASFPVHYVHEPRRGIPMARNRALDEALGIGADWVAFIDDDETAAPDWIAQLRWAADHYGADVVQGSVTSLLPDPLPFWATLRTRTPKWTEGTLRPTASTNNVLLSARLIRADGLAMRFAESMQYTGGSDVDFFHRARRQGMKIVYSERPRVMEEIPPSRLTLRWQAMRIYRNAVNDAHAHRRRHGVAKTAAKYLPRAVIRYATGIGILLLWWPLVFVDKNRFKRQIFRGIRKIMIGTGFLAALVGWDYEPYRTIDGY